ncbi:MAG: hypothetical protein ACRCYV_04230 [Aeromonas sp.]
MSYAHREVQSFPDLARLSWLQLQRAGHWLQVASELPAVPAVMAQALAFTAAEMLAVSAQVELQAAALSEEAAAVLAVLEAEAQRLVERREVQDGAVSES